MDPATNTSTHLSLKNIRNYWLPEVKEIVKLKSELEETKEKDAQEKDAAAKPPEPKKPEPETVKE